MRSTYFYTIIQQPVLLRRNIFFSTYRTDCYYNDISIEMIISSIAVQCNWTMNKIRSDLFCQYRYLVKLSSVIQGQTIDRFKVYVPQIIKSTLNFSMISIYEFLEEIYLNVNHMGKNYIFKTKSSKICFLLEYSILSLLSIYS